jgi:O-methyltransferase domain/Dimerisation domain
MGETTQPSTGRQTLPPQMVLLQMRAGYLLSRALHVAAELGVADLLSAGPKSAQELAAATGTHADSLARLLRMLAAHGVFAEDDTGSFALTPLAQPLQSGVPGSIRDALRSIDDMWWKAAGDLLHSIATGNPAFDHVAGTDFFSYHDRHPEVNDRFARSMANVADLENAAIAGAYDFSQFKCIVDVGGGRGGFLAAVLTTHPQVTGLLYDRPDVVNNPTYLHTAGVRPRWATQAGNFFASIPAGGDAYVFKRVLHDWNDAQCVSLLRLCRDVIPSGGRVLVIDAVVPAGNTMPMIHDSDILMMVLLGGRERREREFQGLFQQAGFRLTRVVPTPSLVSVVEGEPV